MVEQEGGEREGDISYLFYANAFRRFDLIECRIQTDAPFRYTWIMSPGYRLSCKGIAISAIQFVLESMTSSYITSHLGNRKINEIETCKSKN